MRHDDHHHWFRAYIGASAKLTDQIKTAMPRLTPQSPGTRYFCAFRLAAHNAFIRSEAAFFSAADMGGRPLRFPCRADIDDWLLGGRPRRFPATPNASSARFIRSRSVTRAATICSIDIKAS